MLFSHGGVAAKIQPILSKKWRGNYKLQLKTLYVQHVGLPQQEK
jgi:hypothetical protein